MVGTALLALVVHLDGSGAVTFLVTIPAMLPLVRATGDGPAGTRLRGLAGGWRELPSLDRPDDPGLDRARRFPGRAVQSAHPGPGRWVTLRLRRRVLAGLEGREAAWAVRRCCVRAIRSAAACPTEEKALRRPRNFWLNLVLTLLIVGGMVSGVVEPVVLFMLGTAIALVLNYPHADQQRTGIDAHARAALMMAAILMAAGAFTGIMRESGMLAAMARAAVGHLPPGSPGTSRSPSG